MPAEILNRLESLVPEMEASIAKKNIRSSKKADPNDQLKSELMAMKFILNLPIITFEFLHEDERYCALCNSEYDNEFKVCGRGESPCCLPCGHIAGHQCLRHYLSPYERGFTKCPFEKCKVDFPQMFTDSVEPVLVQPTSDLASVDVHGYETSDDELSGQVSQLSRDSGASTHEIKHYLSTDGLLQRSRSQREGFDMATEVQDISTRGTHIGKVGEKEFPKNRKNGASPILARAAMKAVDLITKKL